MPRRSPLDSMDLIDTLLHSLTAGEDLHAMAVSRPGCLGELQAQQPAKAEDCIVLGRKKSVLCIENQADS